MQNIALDCPACGAHSELDPAFSGGVCRCAACGEWIDVPKTSGPRLFQRRRVERPECPTPSYSAPPEPVPAEPDAPDAPEEFHLPDPEATSQLPSPLARQPDTADAQAETLCFTILNGPETGARLELGAGKGCRIGRRTQRRNGIRQSLLALEDDAASRHHAIVLWRGEGWAVADVGSRNGTYVNQRRIDGAVELRHGDVIRIGETLIAVSTLGRPARRTTA